MTRDQLAAYILEEAYIRSQDRAAGDKVDAHSFGRPALEDAKFILDSIKKPRVQEWEYSLLDGELGYMMSELPKQRKRKS